MNFQKLNIIFKNIISMLINSSIYLNWMILWFHNKKKI